MLSLQYKLKKMMIMKKMFSMLFAVVAMAMAFVSCENPEDPNMYCWEVEVTYVDVFGLRQYEDIDVPMTVAEKQAMEEKGTISILGYDAAEIVKITKQDNEECKIY
jgi:hypothetical protein